MKKKEKLKELEKDLHCIGIALTMLRRKMDRRFEKIIADVDEVREEIKTLRGGKK